MALRPGNRVRLKDESRYGTLLSVYEGMKTGTPYVLIEWDDASREHVELQSALELVESKSVP